jgi:hypothetical protein
MAAKTLDEFIKEYRSGFNPITGQQNLFKDLTDEMVWDAAIKSVEEKFTTANKQSTPCPVCDNVEYIGGINFCHNCGRKLQ